MCRHRPRAAWVTAFLATGLGCSSPQGTPPAGGDESAASPPAPLFEASVRPSATPPGEGGVLEAASGRWVALGFDPVLAIAEAHGVPPWRVAVEADLPAGPEYDFVFSTGDEETLRPLMRQVLAAAFGVETLREERVLDVEVLAVAARGPKLEPAGDERGTAWGAGRIRGALELAGLARRLSLLLDRPVLDETGLPGRYELELVWDGGSEPSLQTALTQQLGLELRPERRTLEVLVVRPRTRPDGGQESQGKGGGLA